MSKTLISLLLFVTFHLCLTSCECTTIEEAMQRYSWYDTYHDKADAYMTVAGDLMRQVFADSIMPQIIKRPLEEIADISDVIKGSPCYDKLREAKISRTQVMDVFRSKNINDGAKFFVKYRKLFSVIEDVYNDSIMPILADAPYPNLRDLESILKGTKQRSIISNIKLQKRNDVLVDIKANLAEAQKNAEAAVDSVLFPSINFELDSLIEDNVNTVLEKYSGGFLNWHNISLLWKDNEKKFDDKWEKYIRSQKYNEVFDKYINDFLTDLSKMQQHYFINAVGKDKKRIAWSYKANPITINFLTTDYNINDLFNKFNELKKEERWDFLDYVDKPENILLNKVIGYAIDLFAEEPENPEDYLKLYSENFIHSQIGENYQNSCKQAVHDIVKQSFFKLYSDIYQNI